MHIASKANKKLHYFPLEMCCTISYILSLFPLVVFFLWWCTHFICTIRMSIKNNQIEPIEMRIKYSDCFASSYKSQITLNNFTFCHLKRTQSKWGREKDSNRRSLLELQHSDEYIWKCWVWGMAPNIIIFSWTKKRMWKRCRNKRCRRRERVNIDAKLKNVLKKGGKPNILRFRWK